MLAVKRTEPLPSPSGPPALAAWLAEQVPPANWVRVSAGPGAKGRRWYAWTRMALDGAGTPPGWQRWLLVRRWRSWYRWVTLAMLASAFLVVAAVTERARHRAPLGLIPLTCNNLRHLFAAVACRPAGDDRHWLRWSWWRRRHQARARARHHRRQANRP